MRKKIISIFLAAAVSVAALLMPTSASAATYQGVDIYNGTWIVDFSQLSKAKDFTYIKSSEGEHTADNRYATNVSGAKQFGMRWGPYHFLRMYSTASAIKQADYFWSRIKGSGYTIIPAVDCESHDGQQTAAGIRACIRAFVNEFQRVSGIKPVIYCNTSYANDILRGQFADCRLWQADYRGYAGAIAGWSYSAWQYSSSGVVPGISNRADLDVTNGSIFTGSAPAASGGNAGSTTNTSTPSFPGAKYFGKGKSNAYIKQLDRALIKAGYGRYYKYGSAGASTRWGNGTQRACTAFQRAQGWRGSAADGIPGPKTWARLQKYM